MNRLFCISGGPLAVRPQGCGDEVLTVQGVAASSTLACLRTKMPKKTATENVTNKGRKMEQRKFTNGTNQLFIRTIPILITTAMTIQFLLTGCASINRKEDSIDAILAKENALIEKVKLERAQPEVIEAISKSESLKKAETHLILALDELLKANEVVTMKIINQDKKEVLIERRAASER